MLCTIRFQNWLLLFCLILKKNPGHQPMMQLKARWWARTCPLAMLTDCPARNWRQERNRTQTLPGSLAPSATCLQESLFDEGHCLCWENPPVSSVICHNGAGIGWTSTPAHPSKDCAPKSQQSKRIYQGGWVFWQIEASVRRKWRGMPLFPRNLTW